MGQRGLSQMLRRGLPPPGGVHGAPTGDFGRSRRLAQQGSATGAGPTTLLGITHLPGGIQYLFRLPDGTLRWETEWTPLTIDVDKARQLLAPLQSTLTQANNLIRQKAEEYMANTVMNRTTALEQLTRLMDEGITTATIRPRSWADTPGRSLDEKGIPLYYAIVVDDKPLYAPQAVTDYLNDRKPVIVEASQAVYRFADPYTKRAILAPDGSASWNIFELRSANFTVKLSNGRTGKLTLLTA